MRGRASTATFALTVAATLALLLASTATARTRAYLTPGSGNQTSSFVLRFRSPDQTGTLGMMRRRDVLTVAGPSHDRACVSRDSKTLGSTRQGAHVRLTLNPRRLGGVWCVGSFHGWVTETQTIVCPPTQACPQIMIAPQTILRFSFRVTRGTGTGTGGGGSDPTGAPTFAGLASASTCSLPIVDPPRPQGARYTLIWQPATDPATPSSEIVYDIYFASSSGGENFSSPSWTTAPGAVSFTTPAIVGGPAFFVVRARDRAGREDQNTVQRAGVSDCG